MKTAQRIAAAWQLSAAACLGALPAPLAQAATTVNCTASASGIAFGIYNPLSALADASTGTDRKSVV